MAQLDEVEIRLQRRAQARALELYYVLQHQVTLMEQTAVVFKQKGQPLIAEKLEQAATRGAVLLIQIRGL